MIPPIHSLILETQNNDNDASWRMCNTIWNSQRQWIVLSPAAPWPSPGIHFASFCHAFGWSHSIQRPIRPLCWQSNEATRTQPLCHSKHTQNLLTPKSSSTNQDATNIQQITSQSSKSNARPAHAQASDMFPTIANSTIGQGRGKNRPLKTNPGMVLQPLK